jgi:predicted phosphoribosyltransferase
MVPTVIEEPAYRNKMRVFSDRMHAGVLLAEKLRSRVAIPNPVLLAIPAGGVTVGYAIARELNISLDVIIVRKIQISWDPEAGFGAVSRKGEIVLNEAVVQQLGLTGQAINQSIAATKEAIKERAEKFRDEQPPPDLSNKNVILVDDGLASGFTMLAAVRELKSDNPESIIVAIPTASVDAIELVARETEVIICLNIRAGAFFAVADAYDTWYDVSDDEVEELLTKTRKRHP